MNHMTWQQLLNFIQTEIPSSRLQDNATVYDNTWDEFFPIENEVGISKGGDPADGVLDEGHHYLRIGDDDVSDQS